MLEDDDDDEKSLGTMSIVPVLSLTSELETKGTGFETFGLGGGGVPWSTGAYVHFPSSSSSSSRS